MPCKQIRVLTLGASTCIRPALAAMAIADVLGDIAIPLSVSTANIADLGDVVRLVEQVVGRSVPLLTGRDLPTMDGFDLVIALDDQAAIAVLPGDHVGTGRSAATFMVAGGGYLVCWLGVEPELSVGAAAAMLQELRASAQGLITHGVVALIQARRNRLAGMNAVAGGDNNKPTAIRVFHGLVGESAPMQLLFKVIRKTAKANASALILGETGSGKELVARAIHAESGRATKPFVAINCAAVPHDMAESELFGHRRGAFSGAYDNRIGQFRAADGGSLFLDEVGDLPLALQAKLLRVIETHEVRAVGTDIPVTVDVRVVAATHKNLLEGVRDGWFREDLYYRLAVAVITVPALRDHIEDVPLIAEHILDGIRREAGRPYAQIGLATLQAWSRLAWPGNVRQLQNLVISASVHASGLELPVGHLLPATARVLPVRPPIARARHPRFGERKLDVHRVRAALGQAGGNRQQAAEALGVSRATLHRFLAEQRDDPPS